MAGDTFLGRYTALRLLGEGGMGRVFLGKENGSGRQVVIKVMHDHIAANPRFRQNFRREMLTMKQFRHPHAVELFDASAQDSQQPCIVMEYVPGVTLDALIQKHGRLAALRFGRLLGQLCEVLYAAHRTGIIHRDLTPVNVMVMQPDTPSEKIKVMDFGLALMGATPYIPLEKLQGTGHSIGGGTPDYVCPEQIRGDEVDHRGDLYSLGVLMFKALTGKLPFETVTEPAEILRAHVETPPPTFAAVAARIMVPHLVEKLVQSCLSKFPTERPQDALEVARRYGAAVGQEILPEGEVMNSSPPPPVISTAKVDPASVVDSLEAWMPEAIAVVKLRGFVHDIGGEIMESEPGLIRFRLPDPAFPPEPPASTGLFAMLGLSKKKPPPRPTHHALLDLLLAKKDVGQRNRLQITVMMRPEQNRQRVHDPDWPVWCSQVCRDLRAYLIGR
jgi:serine/threonine-protein kinase